MTQTLLQSIHDEARVPRTAAGWRCVIGEIAEQRAAEVLGAERLTTSSANGERYCPDLRKGNVEFEVKSSGASGAVLIYRWRLDKDREYAKTHTLCYVLVCHTVRCPQPSAREARLLMEWAKVYVIPFCYVDAVCVTTPPRFFSRKFMDKNIRGDLRGGYALGGYALRAKALIEAFPYGRIQ